MFRIIPAYAGSTSASTTSDSSISDHPRIRGEHGPPMPVSSASNGSSPHTRGALPAFDVPVDFGGIIPAYAGSTSTHFFLFWSYSDHPRIRGEHRANLPVESADCGSSPHTRGARRGWCLFCSRTGDHPRIRGEHFLLGVPDSVSEGSSPHTRGALEAEADRVQEDRIIPAYAGSTIMAFSFLFAVLDHPRIRGEHLVEPDQAGRAAGSSPHTRGAQVSADGPHAP